METLNSIMVVCGWLITLGGAGAVIYKLLHPAFKLKKKNRVDKLEINVEKDYKSIQEIRDMQSLLCQGMIALIDNRITGNNIEGLKKKKTKEAMIKHLSEGI